MKYDLSACLTDIASCSARWCFFYLLAYLILYSSSNGIVPFLVEKVPNCISQKSNLYVTYQWLKVRTDLPIEMPAHK